jgi:hypothetical protein
MDGVEKVLAIIVVASMLMMGVVAYSVEQSRQVCFAAAGSNPEAIKACR